MHTTLNILSGTPYVLEIDHGGRPCSYELPYFNFLILPPVMCNVTEIIKN